MSLLLGLELIYGSSCLVVLMSYLEGIHARKPSCALEMSGRRIVLGDAVLESHLVFVFWHFCHRIYVQKEAPQILLGLSTAHPVLFLFLGVSEGWSASCKRQGESRLVTTYTQQYSFRIQVCIISSFIFTFMFIF